MYRTSSYPTNIDITRAVYAAITAGVLLFSTVGLAFGQSMSTTEAGTSGNPPSTDNFNLTDGYTIEPVIWNLTAPDSVTFDDQGNMYIAEAGSPFTGLAEPPRILKVDQNGNVSVLADTGFNAPIVDVAFHNDTLFVSHRHTVSTVDMTNGTVNDIITGLPTSGDHHVNQIAFSPDGERLYFGTGSVTNSGVVTGDDPVNSAWLANASGAHDVPAQNITLAGENYVSPNPLTPEEGDNATTGAFVPFGNVTEEGQVIEGDLKCTSCILSANLDGTDLQLEGWGFRNPSGLAFNDEGRLFATVHGADERSSRPIANDNDKFYEIIIDEPAWYGWPDYFGSAERVTDEKFQSNMSSEPLELVMQDHPAVEEPLTLFESVHSAAIQMDFADSQFGFEGEAFVAQMGAFFPTPPEQGIVGQNVVRVNTTDGTISEFLTLIEPSTSFRPTDAVFHEEDGATALYIVDWGNLTLPPQTIPNTGVVWKITTSDATVSMENQLSATDNQTSTANVTSMTPPANTTATN